MRGGKQHERARYSLGESLRDIPDQDRKAFNSRGTEGIECSGHLGKEKRHVYVCFAKTCPWEGGAAQRGLSWVLQKEKGGRSLPNRSSKTRKAHTSNMTARVWAYEESLNRPGPKNDRLTACRSGIQAPRPVTYY